MKRAIGLVMLFAVSIYALAQVGTFKNLEGQYSITTKDIIDPLPKDRPDRVLFSITGQSAKDIFNAMPAAARRMSCDGTKDKGVPPTKIAGGLECTGDEAEGYVCTVGIMLDSGKTTRGYVCD